MYLPVSLMSIVIGVGRRTKTKIRPTSATSKRVLRYVFLSDKITQGRENHVAQWHFLSVLTLF